MSDFVVECRFESGCDAVPLRFGRPGQLREIVAIVDRWDGEDHRYFRVVGDDDATYILRQDLGDATWQLHFFRSER